MSNLEAMIEAKEDELKTVACLGWNSIAPVSKERVAELLVEYNRILKELVELEDMRIDADDESGRSNPEESGHDVTY